MILNGAGVGVGGAERGRRQHDDRDGDGIVAIWAGGGGGATAWGCSSSRSRSCCCLRRILVPGKRADGARDGEYQSALAAQRRDEMGSSERAAGMVARWRRAS